MERTVDKSKLEIIEGNNRPYFVNEKVVELPAARADRGIIELGELVDLALRVKDAYDIRNMNERRIYYQLFFSRTDYEALQQVWAQSDNDLDPSVA